MSTKIKLTKKQKEKLLIIKRKHKSSLVRDRAQAVLARNEGLVIYNIAKALSRSENFVKKAIRLFNDGELEELNFNSNNSRLTTTQKGEIVEIIKTKSPEDLKGFGFKEQFWSTDALKIIIKKKCGVEYKTEKSYYDIFKLAGFSFHKPKTKDYRQDKRKIKKFKGALKKSYETTKIRLSW